MKKLMLASMIAVSLTGFSGCTVLDKVGDTVTSPARQVFAAKQTYQAALTVAVAYKELPSCDLKPKPVLCSDKAVVTTIQKADVVVNEALNTAERVVRNTAASNDSLTTAVIWAKEAINAFSRVTGNLKVK